MMAVWAEAEAHAGLLGGHAEDAIAGRCQQHAMSTAHLQLVFDGQRMLIVHARPQRHLQWTQQHSGALNMQAGQATITGGSLGSSACCHLPHVARFRLK